MNPLSLLSRLLLLRKHISRQQRNERTYRAIVILALAGVALGGATSSVAVSHFPERDDSRRSTAGLG